jgi:ABC-type glycerol-3-phosphate transport system permease component
MSIVFVILPVYITFIHSFKTDYDIQMSHVFALPARWIFSNWNTGFFRLLPNMLNSIAVCVICAVISALLAYITAYTFTRFNFPGKNVLFSLIIALMLIPGLLTLTPLYLVVTRLGLRNTWFAVILPWIASGQVGAVFLFRTFLSQQPSELFESARIDGAQEARVMFTISMPLAVPIIILQLINTFSGLYNDYIWSMMVIDNKAIQLLMAELKTLTSDGATAGGDSSKGLAYAMYLLAGIPLILVSVVGMKYFISGDFASGLKL